MAALRFTAEIKISNINPYILISSARAKRLKPGWKKPLPVLVKVNGKPEKHWRINMMPMGMGRFYLYLHENIRKASNTKVGDRVEVEVLFDSKYRAGPVHPMPKWFSHALNRNSKAKIAWDALIPSRKKEVLRYFSLLKSPEARVRNLEKAVHVLSGKPGRFMARSWNNGK
jgi:hypothetical protein